jgi:regulatory protein
LDDIDAGRAEQRLEKLLENKCRSLKDDPKCKMKLIRFALGRGYTYEQVRPVIDALLKS